MSGHYLVGDVAYPPTNAAAVESGKRVLVIDPEDRVTVERLAALLRLHGGGHRYPNLTAEKVREDADAMQAALRFRLTPPPKPPEPQGLGAVVEDDKGRRWIRVDWKFPWCLAQPTVRAKEANAMHGMHRPWSEIAAVRVLSEGVSDD